MNYKFAHGRTHTHTHTINHFQTLAINMSF